jgi:hypothetical protein
LYYFWILTTKIDVNSKDPKKPPNKMKYWFDERLFLKICIKADRITTNNDDKTSEVVVFKAWIIKL